MVICPYVSIMEVSQEYVKGRGAQMNTRNPYDKQSYTLDEIDSLHEPFVLDTRTEYFSEHPKKIVNKVESPDLGLMNSANPYQGCEHGCIYCYARNSHQYWGFSAGFDFESKIMLKENAPALLRKALDNPRWKPQPIVLSGNTDCYQPIERKMKITRQMLEIFLEYRNPVGMITKISLILRDADLLQDLAAMKLAHINISITTLNESLRQKMEPRTTTSMQRLKVVEELSKRGVPVNVMVAPVIPSLNDHEIPEIIKQAADRGALSAAYTIVRLNGSVAEIFEDWVKKNFPDRADKVLKQIASCHGGQLNDSRWGTRMRGEGNIAEVISRLFKVSRERHMKNRIYPPYDLSLFRRPQRGQLSLFD